MCEVRELTIEQAVDYHRAVARTWPKKHAKRCNDDCTEHGFWLGWQAAMAKQQKETSRE